MSTADRDALQDQIVSYLLAQLADGTPFVKSRHIASELDMSAKRVGHLLTTIEREDSRVNLERRGGNSDGTTWRIEAGEAPDP